MVVVPEKAAHEVVEVDLTAVANTTGIRELPMVVSATEADAVEEAGEATVVTAAQSVVALTTPVILATHGVEEVDEEVVVTGPVSGVGGMSTHGEGSLALAASP
jgi:hypothetical protein